MCIEASDQNKTRIIRGVQYQICPKCNKPIRGTGKTISGISIWVTKDYIKRGRRVPFSDRWLTLCKSVGFRLVCRHQAMLVKDHGTQVTIHGEEKITTERKSFFRRLAESKGSPRIDWEDIICLERIPCIP